MGYIPNAKQRYTLVITSLLCTNISTQPEKAILHTEDRALSDRSHI